MEEKISLQILVVAENENAFSLIRGLLCEIKTFAFEIYRAKNFSEARTALDEKRLDVCLIDDQPEQIKTTDFLSEISAEGFRVPVILFTDSNDSASNSEYLNAGATDYLVKNKVGAEQIGRAIRYVLGRKQTQRILEESAKREREMFRNVPDMICTSDADGRFISVNPACFKILGYSSEEMIGRRYIDMVLPEDIPRTIAIAADIIAGREIIGFENRFFHKNGSLVNLLWNAHWSDDDQMMYGVAHDITVRKQVEAALRESESRYRLLFENNPTPTWIWDAETLEFLLVNQKAIEFFGYSSEEFQNITTKDLRPPEDLPIFQEYLRQAEAGIEKFDAMRLQKKDGTVIEAEITLQEITFGGRKARVTLINDITERTRIEAVIRRSEEKYRNILETIEEGYFEADLRGDFTFFNDTLCNLLGYSRDELSRLNYKDYTDEKTANRIYEIFNDVYKTGQPRSSLRWEIICKNGEQRLHESSVALRRNEANKIIGFRGIVRDVTELQQSERRLQQSQELLRLMIDTLPQAIWWKDSQGVYKGANSFIAKAAGFESPEQMIGLTDYDMPWTKAEADLYRAVDRRVMQSGAAELDMIETQLQHDGRVAVVTTNKVPLRDAEGQIVGVLGTFADITEQRRAVAALRESEYKLRTLLESMREGLLQVDIDDKIIFVNDCFCEMVEYSPDELMGKSWTHLIFDGDGQELIKKVNERRRDGISDSYELCLRKKYGEQLWVLIGGAPILNSEGIVTGSMGVFTDITTRKRAEEQLLHDAFHDGLTGLANRTLFNDHLQKAIARAKRRPEEMFAVLFLDFDRFKVINDSLGHTEGDNLLKQIARRLESCLRAGDLVARLGGDEFTILVNKIDDSTVAMRVAERIQANLREPFEIGGSEIFTSASIGIALSTTGHEKAEDMVRDADIAMYRAKARGKAQHQVFDRVMHEQASKQLRLETEMHRALEREEFLLHYQPIFRLENEQLVGFESLVRWRHPKHGMIPPFEFIPAAEENGLIVPLGKWILDESCRQMRLWQKNFQSAQSVRMSVNLSSKQFLQPDLVQQICATLEKTGLRPESLKLEITESHIMENSEAADEMMKNLRELGIEMSLDDFGTGYSSLSYLHRLPVSYLKIDRSFVNRMIISDENSEIVHTIIKLAQNLKKQVVAEGIETAEQLAQLKILNCEFGQGYYFAAPMEAKAAEEFLNHKLENGTRTLKKSNQ